MTLSAQQRHAAPFHYRFYSGSKNPSELVIRVHSHPWEIRNVLTSFYALFQKIGIDSDEISLSHTPERPYLFSNKPRDEPAVHIKVETTRPADLMRCKLLCEQFSTGKEHPVSSYYVAHMKHVARNTHKPGLG